MDDLNLPIKIDTCDSASGFCTIIRGQIPSDDMYIQNPSESHRGNTGSNPKPCHKPQFFILPPKIYLQSHSSICPGSGSAAFITSEMKHGSRSFQSKIGTNMNEDWLVLRTQWFAIQTTSPEYLDFETKLIHCSIKHGVPSAHRSWVCT